MMNKKANFFVNAFLGILGIFGALIVTFLVVLLIVLIISSFTIPFLNSGSSVDVAYGLESNSFWYRFYLKDDHKTVYCIDSSNIAMIELAQRASEEKLKVKVTYQDYIFKGSMCIFDEQYSGTVVTKLEIIK